MRRRLLRIALVATLASAAAGLTACAKDDSVVMVAAGDAKMNAAIAEARKTLPVFWSKFDSSAAGAAVFRVKAKMATSGGGVEHIWIDVLSHSGLDVSGRLANEPAEIPGVRLGSEVTVDSGQITDWSYEKNGKVYGAYTQRAMVDQVEPEVRAELLQDLAPAPLEPEVR